MRGALRLFLLGPALAAGLALAQPAVHLAGHETSVSLSGHLALLRDPGGALGIGDVADGAGIADAAGWKPLPGGLSLGFTKDAAWLRVDVVLDPAAPREWILVLADATLEDVRLFSRDAAGRLLERRSGSAVPRGLRPVDHGYPCFPLELAPGSNRFFLRIRTPVSLAASLDLYRPESFANEARAASLGWGLYYGAVLSIAIVQLSFWARTREGVHGWYALYILLYSASTMLTAGLPQQHFGASGPAFDVLRGVTLCGAVGVGSVFNSLALELAGVLPRFNRAYLLLAVSASVAGRSSSARGGTAPARSSRRSHRSS